MRVVPFLEGSGNWRVRPVAPDFDRPKIAADCSFNQTRYADAKPNESRERKPNLAA